MNWELDHSSHFDLGPDQLNLTADYVYKNGGAPNGDSLSAFDTGQFDTDDREKKQAFDTVLSDVRTMGDWTLNPSFSYNYANVLRLNPLGSDAAAGAPRWTRTSTTPLILFRTQAANGTAGFIPSILVLSSVRSRLKARRDWKTVPGRTT